MSNPIQITPVHSNIGPSGAHRWMHCAASVALCARLGLDAEESGEEAARGTVAHFIGSECLIHDQEAWEYAGNTYKEGKYVFDVTPEMVVAVQQYLDLVHRVMANFADKGAILHVERRVKSACDDMAYGTSDVTIEVPGDCIIVIDYKNGLTLIEPDDEQLKLYGEYAYECRSESMKGAGEPTNVKLVICQPNGFHPTGEIIREYDTTVATLTKWLVDEVIPAIAETRNPDAAFVMGSHCKHCPALAHCGLWQDSLVKVPVQLAERMIDLTNEQIAEFRGMKKIATKFFDAVDKEAMMRVLQNGQHIKNCKPVHKIGSRVFKPDMLMEDPASPGEFVKVSLSDAAIKQFGKDKVYTKPELLSVAQVEKLTGGKAFCAQWGYKPTTGLTIADDEDKREPAVGLMELAEIAQKAMAAKQAEPVVV